MSLPRRLLGPWVRRGLRIAGLASLLTLVVALGSCSANPPQRTGNVCAVFDQKSGWWKAARKAQKKWGMPVHVGMAFMHRESSFVADAKPARKRLIGFIPWTRPSSAYGYAQATNEAWKDYKRDTGRTFVGRADIRDALDFIGWYNDRSHRMLGLSKHDAYSLYLAYYVGPTGFKRGVYKSQPAVQGYARRVADRSYRYTQQLSRCEKKLKRGFLFF